MHFSVIIPLILTYVYSNFRLKYHKMKALHYMSLFFKVWPNKVITYGYSNDNK